MTELPWKTIEGDARGQMRGVDGLWHFELNGGGHLVCKQSCPNSYLDVKNSMMTAIPKCRNLTTNRVLRFC
jgi:hypothetical protein